MELYHWDVLATSKEDVSRWMFHLRLVWDVVRTYWLYAVVIYFLDVVTNIFYHVIETYHELVVKCLISDVPATLLRHTEWCCWNVVTTFSCQVEDASKYLRQKVMIMTLVIFWFSYFWLILLKSIYNPYLHFHYNSQLVKFVIRININLLIAINCCRCLSVFTHVSPFS